MLIARTYSPQYPDPLAVHAGDRVEVGRADPEYPGWRWCTGPDGRHGWMPEQWLQRQGAQAIVLRDYTARELGVRAGSEVTLGEEIHGWVWATSTDGRTGWIPMTCLARS